MHRTVREALETSPARKRESQSILIATDRIVSVSVGVHPVETERIQKIRNWAEKRFGAHGGAQRGRSLIKNRKP
jgi:hypothetical protein